MCRDFYAVCENEDGKFIRYYGFTWARDNAEQERDDVTGELLDCAFTCPHNRGTMDVYLRDIVGDPCEYIAEKFSEVYQDQEDISEGACFLMNTKFEVFDCDESHEPKRLHISDVSDHTPCGYYYFDSCDKPSFTYISSKSYANNFMDYFDDYSAVFLAKCCDHCGIEYSVDSNEFLDATFGMVRESLIPWLEYLGFDKRPDGTDF